MVYCKLNTIDTNYDEHFTQSLEKIIDQAVALADDYLIQDDVAESMGEMLNKLDIKYTWISITAELALFDWDEEEIVTYLHQEFANAKYIRVYDAGVQYVCISVDNTNYKLTVDGTVELQITQ